MQLTSEGSNGHPSWSPDGEKIVYSSRRGGSTQIYTMDADGQNKRQLTQRRQSHPARVGPLTRGCALSLGFRQTLCYIELPSGATAFCAPRSAD